MDTAALQAISRGQKRRSVAPETAVAYVARMSTLSKVILKNPGLVGLLESDPPTYHIGQARKIVRMKFPIDCADAENLFAAISVDGSLPMKTRRTPEVLDEEVMEVDETLNAEERADQLSNPAKKICTVTGQTYQNYKSALKWWHKVENPLWEKESSMWPDGIDDNLQNQIHGYKKDIGSKKRDGVMPTKEGKSKYSSFGYVELCKYFNGLRPDGRQNTWREGLFSASFTKTSTATIGRSDNIDDISTENIDARNDSINYKFNTTKSDKAGETTSEIKRIFANPFMPEICLHLDFIVNVMCRHPHSPQDARYLFGGNDQHKRYYKTLKKAMVEIDSSIDLGCNRDDIGTHSNRKWAESMAVSKVDGPTRNQVCLRAGQSVGKVQDCYMKQEDDGDALTGRTVALLQINADQFDVLPPHFKNEEVIALNNFGWNEIIPGYEHYPESFQRAIRFTFPSLVYHFHSGKLKEVYSAADHPLWRVRLFTHRSQLLDSLKDKVLLNFGHCEFTDMYAEGIPALVQVCREVRQEASGLRKEFAAMRDEIRATAKANQEAVALLPKEIVAEMLKHLVVNGAVPITRDNLKDVFSELLNAEDGKLQQILTSQTMMQEKLILATQNRAEHSPLTVPAIETPPAFSGEYMGEYHMWRGVDCQFHKVYLGFEWPSDSAFTLWELWWRGDPNRKVCPYRCIDSNSDLPSTKCKTRRTKSRKVMLKLIEIAISENIIERSADITYANSTNVFDCAYPLLIKQLYGDDVVMRAAEVNIYTLANRLYKV